MRANQKEFIGSATAIVMSKRSGGIGKKEDSAMARKNNAHSACGVAAQWRVQWYN
jgi:hypothetical protein